MRKREGLQEAYVVVYVLTDFAGEVFYVGCTIQRLDLRLKMHLSEARRNKGYTNKAKNEKIRSLDFQVVIKPVDRMKGAGFNGYQINTSCHELEKKWMLKFHFMGYGLTNGRDLKLALKSLTSRNLPANITHRFHNCNP